MDSRGFGATGCEDAADHQQDEHAGTDLFVRVHRFLAGVNP